MASTAKVPEPCTGTVTKQPAAPMISGNRSMTVLLILRNAASREPQSCTIAAFVALAVVSGPGVNKIGSPVSETPRLDMAAPSSLLVHRI